MREYAKLDGEAMPIDTRYAYDPLKQITDVWDAADNHTAVSYDHLGRRTGIDNEDTGRVSYRYDLAGNRVEKLTPNLRAASPKGQPAKGIEYEYDFNRLTDIRYPENAANNVHYEYGASGAEGNRAGRITKVSHGSGYEERWYDALGNVAKSTKFVHLPGDLWHSGQKHNQGTTQPEEYEVFTTAYDYDSFGRLQSMVFPDGEPLTYRYNAGGLPETVVGSYKGSPYPYVKQIGYDAFEQRVRVVLGNGAVTTYAYDDTTRRLSTLSTTSNNYTFQELGYSYDKVGNITGLENSASAPLDGMGGYVKQSFTYDALSRLTWAGGMYDGGDSVEHYTLDMTYSPIHNITRKTQHHWVDTLEGESTKHGTSYDWHYAYGDDKDLSSDATGRGSQPHAPTHIGTSSVESPASGQITGRTFSFDANGNQTGWTDDKNATYRTISWDEENRIRSIDDHGKVSHYGYDDAGQRVIKQARQNLTVYVNPFFTERNGSIGSKHIFVGNTRMLTKVTGGTRFIRSYDGVMDAKLPPGQAKQSEPRGNNGKAVGQGKDKAHSDNGKHLGQLKNADKGNNGKGQAKGQGNNANNKADNGKSGNSGPVNGMPGSTHANTGTAGVNGLAHRSDRANEVAQNTCKNKHLREQYCDANGDGVPDSQEDDGETDGESDPTAPVQEEIVKLGSNGEQLFYYHPDHLGSTGYVTRENGELHEHIQYFPFGETWVQQGGNTEKDPYLFTAKELDEETGLYYFGARYYDPRTSVWQSVDPILEKYLPTGDEQKGGTLPGMGGVYAMQNFNAYGYSHQNPVAIIDPDGKKAEVRVSGNTVYISANIYLTGPGASNAVAKEYQKQIMSDWNSGFSYSHPASGK